MLAMGEQDESWGKEEWTLTCPCSLCLGSSCWSSCCISVTWAAVAAGWAGFMLVQQLSWCTLHQATPGAPSTPPLPDTLLGAELHLLGKDRGREGACHMPCSSSPSPTDTLWGTELCLPGFLYLGCTEQPLLWQCFLGRREAILAPQVTHRVGPFSPALVTLLKSRPLSVEGKKINKEKSL